MNGIIATNICTKDNKALSEWPQLMYWDGAGDLVNSIKTHMHDYIKNRCSLVQSYFGTKIYWRSVYFSGFNEDDTEDTMSGVIDIDSIVSLDDVIEDMVRHIVYDLTDDISSVAKDTIVNYARSVCHDSEIPLKDTRKIIGYIEEKF
jgi:hypothetical protein